MSAHQSDARCLIEDDEGFFHPRCGCEWVGPPVPGLEELVDSLMDHAWAMAVNQEHRTTEAARAYVVAVSRAPNNRDQAEVDRVSEELVKAVMGLPGP